MFRSDQLYSEMNYMIENLSQPLLTQALNIVEQVKVSSDNEATVKIMLSIVNSTMHIFESILSQEELPDFYETNLPEIASIMSFVLEADYPKFQKTPIELIKSR